MRKWMTRQAIAPEGNLPIVEGADAKRGAIFAREYRWAGAGHRFGAGREIGRLGDWGIGGLEDWGDGVFDRATFDSKAYSIGRTR